MSHEEGKSAGRMCWLHPEDVEDVMEVQAQPPDKRRLRVNLADLVDAFDDVSWEVAAYLDLETGEVVRVTAETRQELEAIYEELPEEPGDPETYRTAIAAALERRGLPAWMR